MDNKRQATGLPPKLLSTQQESVLPSLPSIVTAEYGRDIEPQIAAVKSTCQAVLDSLTGDVTAMAESCLEQCRTAHDNCSACISDRFASNIDQWKKLLAKCHTAVDKYVNYRMDTVANRL